MMNGLFAEGNGIATRWASPKNPGGRTVSRFLGVNAGRIVNRKEHPNTWRGEEEVKMYIDGDTACPTLCGADLDLVEFDLTDPYVMLPLMERQDDFSSCCYFYLDQPETFLPKLDPVEKCNAGLLDIEAASWKKCPRR